MTTTNGKAGFTQELDRVLRDTNADFADSLSAEQRRWWLLCRIADTAPATVIARYRVTGRLDVAAVQLGLTRLGARHEALRSVFLEVADRPVRLVLPLANLSLRTVDVRAERDREQEVVEFSARVAAEPFGLRHGPLLRVVLFHVAEGQWELFLTAHRLIADQSSLDVIAGELVDRDRATTGEQPSLSGLFKAQRRAHRQGGGEAWIAELGKRLATPNSREVPSPRRRPEVKRHERAAEVVELSQTAPELAVAELEHRVVAAWLAVLMRYQGSVSAQCGVYMARDRAYGSVVGPLDDTRPVRVDLAEGSGLADLVGGVRGELGAAAERAVPFARLLEICPPERDLSRTPYVQTMIRVVDARTAITETDDARLDALPTEITSGGHDLDVTVWLLRGQIVLQIDYDANLYTADDVWSLARSVSTVLELVLSTTDSIAGTIDGLPLLSGDDPAVSAGQGDQHPVPQMSIVDMVARQAMAAEAEDRTAVHCRGVAVSYRQLWHRSGVIAAALQGKGVRAGDRVAVCLDRGPDAVAGLLAVLRCGAAFVPIDPKHPADRVRYLLTDSGSVLAVSASSTDFLVDLSIPRLRLDNLDTTEAEPRPVPTRFDDTAYVIYTSGSTGRPKGVVVRHRNVVNNLRWRQRQWDLRPGDRVLHNHALSFDPSVWAVFWPLASGAAIVLAVENELDDPAALLRLIRDERVTVLGGVPSMLSVLLAHPSAGEATKVRLLLSGAEPLEPALVERAREVWSAEVANLYGPTETTIDATMHVTDLGARRSVPIGRPIDNVHVHIVDPQLRPVPDMVPGEIIIAGAGVAVGYQSRPKLTAARFLPDPYGEPGGRLFRTGDLGRRLPDGEIEFLGRADDQVKIRGHRVEPREIESVLTQLPEVAAATVVPLRAGTSDARLAAVIVRSDGVGETAAATVESVRSALKERLPVYLVPDAVMVVENLPRTATGKIDRRTLAEQFRAADQTATVRTSPRTPLEEAVAESFERVLGISGIDVDADFFDIGGTSILLARLATLLQARHDVDIPLHEFFRVPSVAGVAETIETYGRGGLTAVLGRQHAAMLERDGCLDESVRPDGLPPADWANPKRVLLTGATGYLGLHLLEELLRRTDAEVLCLCRADHEHHAKQRIRQGFDHYEIDVTDELHRVRCLVGDLGKDRFGLDEPAWHDLASTVDVIYHNGALVNFVYPYSALKAPNVGGTQRVLELACTTRLKAVHHISTIDTLLATHTPRPFMEDGAPLRSAVHVPAGYTGSKWVAEKVVDVARERGIPVTIFRPGLILGHTATGATQATDYLLVAFRGFLPMGILPDYPRIFDTVPVDYVASSVVHISLQAKALGGFYHLFNPAPVSLRTFCGWLTDYGYQFDIVPFEEGRRRALEVGPGHPLYPIVALIRDAEAAPHRALDPEFMAEVAPARECARTLELLAGSDIDCPAASRDDAVRMLDYLVRTGFLARPADIRSDAPAEAS